MTQILRPVSVQNRVRQSFRRGLPSYHDAAVAQAQIAATLAQALRSAGAPAQFGQVLEFGCGTGHLTTQLLQQFTLDHLTLNDLVPDCAAAVQPILKRHSPRASFQAGPIETLPLPPTLDLIASASTVQWVQQPAALISRLTSHLARGGWLALSGFGRAHFAELRALGSMATAPCYLDPQDWPQILPAGLHIKALYSQTLTLQFPDTLGLLRHLRCTGVNANAHCHWTRANLTTFDLRLRAGLPQGAPLTLSYQPVFLIARKAV